MSIRNKRSQPKKFKSLSKKKFIGSTKAKLSHSSKLLSATQDKFSYNADDQRYWDKHTEALTFGRTIRAYRLCEDWSLADAAEKIGISVQQLSDYEHGRKLPSIERAYSIATALGMMPQGVVIQLLNEQLQRAKIALQVKVA